MSTQAMTMKHEIENIKTHFATKADLMRWTVSVGIATGLSVIGVTSGLLLNMDARMMHMDTRLTQEMRDMGKKMREEQQETRKEMRQANATLAKKIDSLNR